MIGQNWRFWCKTSDFEVLSVHDLLQHLASAGEITKQGKSVYEDLALLTLYGDLALLTFYRFTLCTKLPQSLFPMFLFGAVE